MKNLTPIVITIGLFTLSSVVLIDSANAFSVTFDSGIDNLGFEDTTQYNGWSTTGDTTVQSTFQTISPQAGSSQALITNSCHNCVDNGLLRNDDDPTATSTFNYSNTNPITASNEQSSNLQSFLGIDNNALHIPVKIGGTVIDGVTRTPKEGSAILSDTFTTDESFTISFDWNYLTNDGESTLGHQDFSFITITGTTDGGEPVEQVITLGDSDDSISSPSSSNFEDVSGYSTYTSSALAAGSYRLGFGVVDVDGVDRSSGLLVDNIQFTQEVPFEFSPALGIFLVGIVVGGNELRKRYKTQN